MNIKQELENVVRLHKENKNYSKERHLLIDWLLENGFKRKQKLLTFGDTIYEHFSGVQYSFGIYNKLKKDNYQSLLRDNEIDGDNNFTEYKQFILEFINKFGNK